MSQLAEFEFGREVGGKDGGRQKERRRREEEQEEGQEERGCHEEFERGGLICRWRCKFKGLKKERSGWTQAWRFEQENDRGWIAGR